MGPNERDLARFWFLDSTDVVLPEEMQSQTGFMAFHEDKPLACVFFYPFIGCKSAMIGLPIGNRNVEPAMRSLALDACIEAVEAYARDCGYKLLHSWPGRESVFDRLIKHGYIMGDSHCVHVVKGL